MRYLLLFALLSLPVNAKAPRQIQYGCNDEVCQLSKTDWEWVVNSMKAKDEEIARLMRGCGPWRFD